MGEAVISRFSASYPIALCQAMASGAKSWSSSQVGTLRRCTTPVQEEAKSCVRPWFEDPSWVEDVCGSLTFREMFRFRFKRSGHINCLECRVKLG